MAQLTLGMTANRQRSAWILLAVAAIAVVTLARAQDGTPNTAAFTNPVLQFLSGHSNAGSFTTVGIAKRHEQHANRQARASSRGDSSGVWMALMPVFFIGLIAPLSLIAPRAALCLGRAPSAPALPFLFQRPPPSFLF